MKKVCISLICFMLLSMMIFTNSVYANYLMRPSDVCYPDYLLVILKAVLKVVGTSIILLILIVTIDKISKTKKIKENKYDNEIIEKKEE